ncbi:MAG: S46 family peptidase [Bacteroidia bacterium]|nr:S46 family peptidase [Bacteroidia bacterium]
MKRKIFSALIALCLLVSAGLKATTPDEGMWLPLLIGKKYDEMKKLGLKLTAEDIYSINNSSLKDAIVQLGGFCTAEVISDQGLLMTNHHCGYDAIQSHSSVENDYLTNGFWAKTKKDELYTAGLTVSFLVRVEDVTDRVNKAGASAPEGEADNAMGEEIEKIIAEASDGNDYRAEVEDMFYGNEHFLFVYEVFRDIRLVGAPPESVGKFGGDTDNWMWPRHTGDFSMLRVYAGKDNKPADYAEDNVPYKPKHFLPVSLKGVEKGDYAMIMGYPGSTDRYLTSTAIDFAYENSNPDYIKLMDARLKIMKEGMDADPKVRIQLASNYASLANSHKYFYGQNLGLRKRGLGDERREFEAKFSKWVDENAARKSEYGTVLADIKKNYEDGKVYKKVSNYVNIAGFGPAFSGLGIQLFRLQRTMDAKPDDKSAWEPQIQSIKGMLDDHFKDYVPSVDQNILAKMVQLIREDLPADFHPSFFNGATFKKSKAKGSMSQYDSYASLVFAKTILADRAKLEAFLAKPSSKVLTKDPGMEYILSIIDLYRTKMMAGFGAFQANDDAYMKTYMKGIREMNSSKFYYPDANFTMRLTYGKVIPYDPRDAVSYDFYTTTDGILEKENPDDKEFYVPQGLLDLINKKDFGQYADKTGELRVCFLTDNDITGGNSGSPVINGNGELIGVAFDGNWESMTSDLVFDENVVRTISVDIRYVLWIIDKYAGASHLIKEMKIVR